MPDAPDHRSRIRQYSVSGHLALLTPIPQTWVVVPKGLAHRVTMPGRSDAPSKPASNKNGVFFNTLRL